MRRWAGWLIALGACAGLGLFILLAWSTGSASRLAEHHELLVYLNMALAAGLIVWVLGLLARLVWHLYKGQFGARLTGRFALAFILIGVLPGALIYTVSVQFMSKSIESWFNVRVDTALDAGLALGRTALDAQINELDTRAKAMTPLLSEADESDLPTLLARVRDVTGVKEVGVFTGSGRPVSFVTERFGQLLPQTIPSHILNQLRITHGYAAAESVMSSGPRDVAAGMILRVIVPMASDMTHSGSSLGQEMRWLQLIKPVPESLVHNAEEVRAGYRDYQELALSRHGLRQLFGVTLTLALLIAVFASIAVALYLSRRLVQPLLTLASGTRAVSVGDFRPLPESSQNDEVGQLTRSFNAMTQQLEEARRLVETNRRQLERSKVYIESILANLSAGVLVFDEQFRLTTFNQGAQSILGEDLQTVIGYPIETVESLVAFGNTIRRAFTQQAAMSSERVHWQEQLEVMLPESSNASPELPLDFGEEHLMPERVMRELTLLARGTHLSAHGAGNGYVVVFDDISEVISASRSVAWGEVARRLAHEIKNPLTPIQLSAERLAMKLSDKLDENDAALLARSTNTIVNQVGSLKQMVDEFREYARKPPARYEAIDLNDLIEDVLILHGWDPLDGPGDPGVDGIAYDIELADRLPGVRGDLTQLRQVILNLVGNAKEALIDVSGGGMIHIKTEAKAEGLGVDASEPAVLLTISDNGPGFSSQLLQRAFEPYITTKAQGTGLGLAIVRKIVEEHGGYIELSNRRTGGARVTILLVPYVESNAQVDASRQANDN
ncbi:sensor histidine kinase [Orrella sp. 11846]|uniref:sensor histidine kinase n=1 Tax=Orrella sp. 11846 TaxID=3409913 RepID=UPI003B5B5FF0